MGSCFTKQDPHDVVQGRPVVQLSGSAFCPNTLRVLIALQYKCITVERSWMSDCNDTNKHLCMSTYMKPDAKLPNLQHGTDSITGSAEVILHYIESKFPTPRLIPEGPLGDITLQWVVYIRDIFSPMLFELLYEGNLLLQKELIEKVGMAFAKLNEGMKDYNTKGYYFLGNTFTMVDVYLIPALSLVHPLQYFRGVGISSSNLLLQEYCTRMMSFPFYAPVRIDPERLQESIANELAEKAPPPIPTLTVLQHKSILYHLGKLVQNADELAMSRQTGNITDSAKGSVVMQIKRLSKLYTKLLDLMQEHAQMEERIIFPSLERAEKGITHLANEEHARDFPLMNGILEHIKTAGVLDSGSSDRSEALLALSVKMRKLQAHCMEHFQEEEHCLLPLLNAADFDRKEQNTLLSSCFNLMENSHRQYFPYLLSGLLPHEIYAYFEVAQQYLGKDSILEAIKVLVADNENLRIALTMIQKRLCPGPGGHPLCYEQKMLP